LNDVVRAGETEETTGDILELLSNVTLAGFSAAVSEIEILRGNGFSIKGTAGGETFDLSSLLRIEGLAYIDAGAGNDRLLGSRLSNDLRGGSGNDRLTGGDSSDVLLGGSGSDVFVFHPDRSTAAADRVTDFGDKSGNQDIIDFSTVFAGVTSSGFSRWLDLHVKQTGGDAVISLGNDKVVMAGIRISSLDYSDFDFIA
jgi:Ca2+-binding RTX toxin-like protein